MKFKCPICGYEDLSCPKCDDYLREAEDSKKFSIDEIIRLLTLFSEMHDEIFGKIRPQKKGEDKYGYWKN